MPPKTVPASDFVMPLLVLLVRVLGPVLLGAVGSCWQAAKEPANNAITNNLAILLFILIISLVHIVGFLTNGAIL